MHRGSGGRLDRGEVLFVLVLASTHVWPCEVRLKTICRMATADQGGGITTYDSRGFEKKRQGVGARDAAPFLHEKGPNRVTL